MRERISKTCCASPKRRKPSSVEDRFPSDPLRAKEKGKERIRRRLFSMQNQDEDEGRG